MQVIQGRHNLSAVEAGPVLRKHPLPGQVEEKLRDENPEPGQPPRPGPQGRDPNPARSGEGGPPNTRVSKRAALGQGPTSPPLAYSMTKHRRSCVWKEYFRACEGSRAGTWPSAGQGSALWSGGPPAAPKATPEDQQLQVQ